MCCQQKTNITMWKSTSVQHSHHPPARPPACLPLSSGLLCSWVEFHPPPCWGCSSTAATARAHITEVKRGRTCREQRALNHRDFLNNTPERNYHVWYLSENLTLNSFWPSDGTECVSTALCCVLSGESFRTHTDRCKSLNPALFEVVELNVRVQVCWYCYI